MSMGSIYKAILSLVLSLSIYSSSAMKEWDSQNNLYVNTEYGFAWMLTNAAKWNIVEGMQNHTVFKAKCLTAPVVVYVNINDYNSSLLDRDVWLDYENLKLIREKLGNSEYAKAKGLYQKIIESKKDVFSGHNIVFFHQELGMKSNIINSEPPSYQYILVTYHKGHVFTASVTAPKEFCLEVEKQGVNLKSILKGLSFQE